MSSKPYKLSYIAKYIGASLDGDDIGDLIEETADNIIENYGDIPRIDFEGGLLPIYNEKYTSKEKCQVWVCKI